MVIVSFHLYFHALVFIFVRMKINKKNFSGSNVQHEYQVVP